MTKSIVCDILLIIRGENSKTNHFTVKRGMMMKFRPFFLIAAALLISTTAIGCSPEPEESETPSRKMTTAAQQESELKITRSEAANLLRRLILKPSWHRATFWEAVKNAANTEPSTMVMQAAHTMKRTTAIQSNARQPVGDMTAMEMLLTNINSTQLYISMEKPVLLHQVILCCPKTD